MSRRAGMLLTAVVLGSAACATGATIRIMPMGDSITWGYDHSNPETYPGVTQKEGGYRVKLYNKLVEAGYDVAFCGSRMDNNPVDAPDAAKRHEGWSGYTISRAFYAAYDTEKRFGGVLETIPTSFKTAQNPHVILLHLGSNVGSMGNNPTISAGLGMNGAETLKKFGLRDMSRLLDALSEKQPGAEIIVTTLLNRDHHRDGTDTAQPGVVAFNAGLPALVAEHVAKGQKVHFFDMNPYVPLADMPDGIHPNETGYAKMADGWFAAITQLIPDPAAFKPNDAPGIVASSHDGTMATIWYNQPMGASAGDDVANYSLGKPSITVTEAALDGGNARQVNLTLSAVLPDSETVELFAQNVANASGGAVSAKCSTPLVDLSSETWAKGIVVNGGLPCRLNGEREVVIFRQNGKITIPFDGIVEVLLVGGGGGGGTPFYEQTTSYGQSGGGGGGGVVYKKAIRVRAGTYDVTVGGGGAVGANGGDSSVFNLTAFGGGAGSAGFGNYGATPLTRPGADGASGGGAATGFDTPAAGGSAIHAAEDNFGHAGSSVTHLFGCGGGGGAGQPGAVTGSTNDGVPSDSQPHSGGDGIEIPMLAPGEYYGGGGAAYRSDNNKAVGGKGGGGNKGEKGEDGRGGGGCGGCAGGSGLVVIGVARATLDEAPADSDDFAVAGGDEVVLSKEATARIFRTDGTLKVTGSGYLEFLIVGGGGGGGARNGAGGSSGGGGGGGVMHVGCMAVTAGDYTIMVGAGGAVGANGGDSSVQELGFTAFGGGAGAAIGGHDGVGGASGGGGVTGGADRPGGAALYKLFGNLGNPGGTSSGNTWGAAGGGGAGAPGGNNDGSQPGGGGDGYACSILGKELWFAGGGAGARSDGFRFAAGGKGGGGSGLSKEPYGTAGEDGLGGGGAGDRPGGKGTVIVRYRKAEYLTEFRDAKGGTMTSRDGYRIHTFTADGTFTMPCNGYVEVLLVGGGGGGGVCSGSDELRGGGGGGGGGFLYTDATLTAGEYTITVGAGGAVKENGGNSTAFANTFYAVTAYGGGAGANFDGRSNPGVNDGDYGTSGAGGASGGGATHIYNTVGIMPGGPAIYGAEGNLGNPGGSAEHVYGAGGGGGAGAPGGNGVGSTPGNGGDGAMCAITGEEVYYGGGGSGFRGSTKDYAGGKGGGGGCSATMGGKPGTDGLGGGGCGGQKGGSGVVIIRYKLKPFGTFLIFR